MIYNQIQKLIPFVNENFVTFPLAITEGIYIPFYNFWQSLSTKEEVELFLDKARIILKDTGYTIGFQYEEDDYIYDIERDNANVYFQIYPIFESDDDNDSNVFVNVDPLSFDVDAIDLLIKIIDK
jgi:hypothetical protein